MAKKLKNDKKIFNLYLSNFCNVMKEIFVVDKCQVKIMNILSKYNLNTQINLIFALIALHNFIKNHFSQDIDYFEIKDEEFIVYFNKFDNLLLKNFFISIYINKKRDIIATAI